MEHVENDTKPPKVSSTSPSSGAIGVAASAAVRATFNEAMNPATVNGSTVALRNSSNTLVPSTVSYSSAERRVTITPSSPLAFSSVYTASIKGGPTGVADLAGNRLAADSTWSFTTTAPPPPPPNEGPGGPILVISNAGNPFSQYYAEILRAEGLNDFAAADISEPDPGASGLA